MLNRAYATLVVKSVDDEQRIIEGIASSPVTDRVGDVLEPKGAAYQLPIPLLWQHRSDQPIGQVIRAKVTKTGIEIRAQIAKGLLPRIDEAWALIKSGLVKGLSVGFRPLEDPEPIKDTFGYRFTKWEWLELSAVTVPANADATISLIKSLDADDLAASGVVARSVHPPGASGVSRTGRPMKSISEQLTAKKAELKTKSERLDALRTKADGETLDATEVTERTEIVADIERLSTDVAELAAQEKAQSLIASPVTVTAPHVYNMPAQPHVTVTSNVPKGMGFVHAVQCKMASFLSQGSISPVDIARSRFPDDPRVVAYLKTATTAHTTADGTNTGGQELVYAQNLTSEFIELLAPTTIVGKFGTNGIPSLRRIPFNVRIVGQTTGGTAGWVGEGKLKPVRKFDFNATSLTWAKLAAITVQSDELARFSNPSSDALLRSALEETIRQKMDVDFIDPANAGSAGVYPASITRGITALTESGTDAVAVRKDFAQLVQAFINANNPLSSGVIITSESMALQFSLMMNALGQPEFPGVTVTGGRLLGFPVITSQYATTGSPDANLFCLVNASDIFLADDGQISVDVSREASVEMGTDPENESATVVSLWQANLIGLRAERYINWARRRTSAVAYFDAAAYAAGSPV